MSRRRRYEPDPEAANRALLAAEPDEAAPARHRATGGLGRLMLDLQSAAGNAALARLVEGGERLPPDTAALMGGYLGADLSAVRVHTGAGADALSRSIDATAFTVGQDIFFSSGSYRPERPPGRELLAHELTHVVQQQGPGPIGGPTRVSRPDEPAEVEAREIGAGLARGSGASPHVQAAGTIHREAAGSGMSEERKAKLIAVALDQATVSGGDAKDRAALAEDLEDSDIHAESWFADMVPDATFLGLPIGKSAGSKAPGIHQELYDVLQQAEEELLSRHPGLSPRQVAKKLGVYAIVGLRPPKKATGGEGISMHCFGMAVDINYRGNPFIGQGRADSAVVAATEHATLLMSGTPVNVKESPHRLPKGGTADSEAGRAARTERAGRMWDRLHGASDTLRAYLSLSDADLVALVEANDHGHDIGWWRERLAEDQELHDDPEFKHHTDPAKAGFMDLPRELVEVLVGAGLSWGGCYAAGKDLMHFDLRTGTIHGKRHPVL
jgi:hypothetical protein